MARAVDINLKARINIPASTIANILFRLSRDGIGYYRNQNSNLQSLVPAGNFRNQNFKSNAYLTDHILFDLERQHTFFFDKCFQLVTNNTFANTGRCSGKDEIPDIDGEVGRNICYDLIKIVKHQA